ncbi:unnamed protein product [Caenorhabditis auriculariae]|uniref:Protein MCM10 homolog n=1 Tax=Caenorhabditis auriculariae TaxID=2777116 RepID=A0A8S1GWD4_9PELO|nr:unnamed protein product [Caenorhabditis auriculariae]
MDPLDDIIAQLGEVEESTSQTKSKEILPGIIEADFVHPTKVEEVTKNDSQDKFFEDDSDDDELTVDKKELNESGKQLESWLKKSDASEPRLEAPWKAKTKALLKEAPKLADENFCVAFDKFGISVRNPKVSSQTFGMFTAGMQLVRSSDLRPSNTFKDSWCTMAVIVEKSLTKKSNNGNEYLVWRLHDLKDCQSATVKLLIFGEAVKERWKLPLGMVVALMSAQVADDAAAAVNGKSKNTGVTLKVSKPTQIVEIGPSAHFGVCKGTKQDGNPCSNFVNKSLGEYCVYHVMNAARKLSARRGTFNAVTCGPNVGGLSVKRPAAKTPLARSLTAGSSPLMQLNSPSTSLAIRATSFNAPSTSGQKTTTKEEEKAVLDDIISSRKNSLGTRQVLQLKRLQEGAKVMKSSSPLARPASFTDFIKKEEMTTLKESRPQTIDLSNGLKPSGGATVGWPSSPVQAKKPMGARDAQEHAARLRAIAVLKKQREEAKAGVKRKAPLSPMEPAKKAKTGADMDEIQALLNRKSIHHQEATKEEGERLQKYLSGLEERERVETFTTTCMSVKNVKVVTCKQCKYTAQAQSNLCREAKHEVVKHDAEKRFFKCSSCKKRTVCFELMPIKPCNTCNETKWERVAMRDERKVVLENEKLLLRGEERTFVNV